MSYGGDEGWRFAADAARITEESASSGDWKHTSGRVFVAIEGGPRAVVDKEEETVRSCPGNEGRIAQA